jgi:hypothetical protein
MTQQLDPPAKPGGAARRLAVGFGLQSVFYAVQIVLQFAAVPVFLSAWGAPAYADWLMLSAAANLMVLGDLGLQGFLSNRLRLAWMGGDEGAGRRVLATGLGAYAGLMALALALGLALTWAAGRLGWRPLAGLDHGRETLGLLIASVVLLLPRGLVATVYTARGHFSREIGSFIILFTGQQGAALAAAAAGAPPVWVAAAHLAASLVFGWGWLAWDIPRWRGGCRLAPQRPSLAEMREMCANAPFHAVQMAAGVLLVQVPVIALGFVSGQAAVVAFSTMRTYTGLVRHLAAQFGTAAGLELTRCHARGEHAQAGRLFGPAALLSGGVSGLGAAASLVLGPAFFLLWTNGKVVFDPWLATGFLGASILLAPTLITTNLARLVDVTGSVVARALAWQVAATGALCLALATPLGALGAALAVGASELLVAPLLVAFAARTLGQALSRPVRHALLAAAAMLLVGLVAGHVVSPAWAVAGWRDFVALGAAWSLAVAPPVLAAAWGMGRLRARTQGSGKVG